MQSSLPYLSNPSFTSKPTGHVYVKVFDRDRWSKDDFLGEVSISGKQLETGDPIEGWYELEKEPKKKKNPEKGEIRLKLHFPLKKVPSSFTFNWIIVRRKRLKPLPLRKKSLPRRRPSTRCTTSERSLVVVVSPL